MYVIRLHKVFNKTRLRFSNIENAETAQYNVPLQPLKPIIRKETAHPMHFRWGRGKINQFPGSLCGAIE